MKTTERQRQELAAREQQPAHRWSYVCDDGEPFSAIAPSEGAAFRVLNAERPGMRVRFVGHTSASTSTSGDDYARD